MPEKKVTIVPLENALEKAKEPVEVRNVVQSEPTSPEVPKETSVKPIEEVKLPTEEVSTEKVEDVKESTKKASKYTILVAEDERPLSRALELKLTNRGFNVLIALDGEEAVEKLKSNKVDLAILDIVMPKLDGFGVLAKIKELKIKVISVVISNLSQDEDKAKALGLGASEYFIKSDIPINDIVSYIIKTLNA